MSQIKKVAVAGATGRVGKHVVAVLGERGYQVVPMSRASGVDVITADGLAAALEGVDAVVDASTGPSPDYDAATEFFTTSAANLRAYGEKAGVQLLVVVSIIGVDKFAGGYGAAKQQHEQAALAGPTPARILRAAQFHEFVEQLMQWGTQGEVAYVPKMRTQLVAARTVAEALVELTVGSGEQVSEIAGPREESLVDAATLLAARRGNGLHVIGVSDPDNPEHVLMANGDLLPGPGAVLAGPTFEQWLDETNGR